MIAGGGENLVATASADGLILIDGGIAGRSEDILAVLKDEFGATTITWVFNTHWHREQSGLNEWAGRNGAVLCAHENTRLWQATEYYVDWQDRTYEPLPAIAQPTRTFYGSAESASIGGRHLEFGLLPRAHTDGDIYVHLVDEDILAVGGALTPGAYPLMDYATGGWLRGVLDASTVLAQRASSTTRIVAATGGVVALDAVEAQLELATTLHTRIANQLRLGKSVQDMLDEGVTRDYDARFGDPGFFVRSAYRGMWGNVRDYAL